MTRQESNEHTQAKIDAWFERLERETRQTIRTDTDRQLSTLKDCYEASFTACPKSYWDN